jgi:hypothetical protein
MNPALAATNNLMTGWFVHPANEMSGTCGLDSGLRSKKAAKKALAAPVAQSAAARWLPITDGTTEAEKQRRRGGGAWHPFEKWSNKTNKNAVRRCLGQLRTSAVVCPGRNQRKYLVLAAASVCGRRVAPIYPLTACAASLSSRSHCTSQRRNHMRQYQHHAHTTRTPRAHGVPTCACFALFRSSKLFWCRII